MSQRLLVVAQHFWPLTNDAAMRLLYWSSSLVRAGYQVTVLTPRWNSEWPAVSVCREVEIVRLSPAPKSAWSETYYTRQVGRWIDQRSDQLDIIYIDAVDTIAYHLALPSVRGNKSICVRFDNAFENHLTHRHLSNSNTSVLASQVDRIITSRRDAINNYIETKKRREQVLCIPHHSSIRFDRNDSVRKESALRALYESNADLYLSIDAKLILIIGEIDDVSLHLDLVHAIGLMTERDPLIRVWYIGGGNNVDEVYQVVKANSWHHDILFHGCFDDLSDILGLASLIIIPEVHTGSEFLAPNAIANGIPMLINSDADWAREFVPSIDRFLFSPDEAITLGTKIEELLHLGDNAYPAELRTAVPNESEAIQAWSRCFKELSTNKVAR